MNLIVKIFISLIYQIHKYYLNTWEDLLVYLIRKSNALNM